MKNRTVLILLATLTATILLFNGCGKSENETEPVVSETVEEIEDTVSVAEPEIVEDIVEEELTEVEETDNTISDNWEDLEFLLEGVKCKIPCHLKEFEKTGWIFQPNGAIERNIIPHGYYGSDPSLLHESNRGRINVYPYNDTDEVIHVTECITDGVNFDPIYRDNVINVVLAKGITFESTKQEVLDAYGEPYKINKDPSSKPVYTVLEYISKDKFVRMDIWLDENECVDGINLHWDYYLKDIVGMPIYDE